MGEKEKVDEDSVNTPKNESEQDSMFGNDVNKKSGKPIRGYRWMAFTFFMIILLCIIVMFHDKFNAMKADLYKTMKEKAKQAKDMALGITETKPATGAASEGSTT